MSEVFISYAREDRQRVEELAQALEADGLDVWWDRSIPAGETFDDVIQDALNAARCVVVVWSRHSVGSRWVRTEADEGVERGILVPVLIDDVRVPLAFRRLQSIELVGGSSSRDGVFELVASVRRVLGMPMVTARTTRRARRYFPSRRALLWAVLIFGLLLLAWGLWHLSGEMKGGVTGPSVPEQTSCRGIEPSSVTGDSPYEAVSSDLS